MGRPAQMDTAHGGGGPSTSLCTPRMIPPQALPGAARSPHPASPPPCCPGTARAPQGGRGAGGTDVRPSVPPSPFLPGLCGLFVPEAGPCPGRWPWGRQLRAPAGKATSSGTFPLTNEDAVNWRPLCLTGPPGETATGGCRRGDSHVPVPRQDGGGSRPFEGHPFISVPTINRERDVPGGFRTPVPPHCCIPTGG